MSVLINTCWKKYCKKNTFLTLYMDHWITFMNSTTFFF
uniref:Uncharacterized protein n=1 Tax=Arundo donax TaxID=35708 RepID=A0A0A9GQ31_ARUDO